MIEIELTAFQLWMAGMVGVARHVKGAWKPGRYGIDNSRSGWQSDCDGACGELAVARWRNVFYDGRMGDFGAKDAGDLQVRTTPNANGHLVLHPGDPDEDIFVLVLSHRSPVMILRGWCYGYEGKRQELWRDGSPGRPAFWVSQSELNEMENLLACVGPG